MLMPRTFLLNIRPGTVEGFPQVVQREGFKMFASNRCRSRSGAGVSFLVVLLILCSRAVQAANEPALPVWYTVHGSKSIKSIVESRLTYELTRSGKIERVKSRGDARLHLDINATDLSSEHVKLPLIAVSVVVLENRDSAPFLSFAIRNGARLGSRGLLYAWIRGDHLRSVCQHAVYTTNLTRISQTCAEITQAFEQNHVEPRLKLTRWLRRIAKDFAQVAAPVLAARESIEEEPHQE